MPLPYPTLPGQIDHMIADDHAMVDRMFEHLEAGRGNRRVLVDQVAFQLAMHADAEERVLYPELKKAGMIEQESEAIEEHQEAKELLVVLQKREPGEPEFEEALAKLIGGIRHHVEEEETEVLPQLREKIGAERLVQLGQEFLKAKRTAPTYAHPAAPNSAIGHKLADAGAVVVDKMRDRVTGRKKTLATDASGLLDPQAQAIVDALSSLEPLPFEILTAEQARKQPGPVDAVKALLESQGKPTDPEPVGSVEDVTIPGGAGQDMKIRIYKPEAAGTEPLPILLWIHGGGWVLFDIDTYDASCRGLTNKTGALVVSPDYRRAPEDVFPAAHDDVLATWRWLVTNGADLGGDPANMAIGGESAGGNMAAATTYQLKTAGEPVPAAQVLVYPLTTAEQYGDSFVDAADAHPLNRPLVSWMAMHAFEGKTDAANDPRINLLGLSADELAGMPPTLVITNERDPLRDQGEEFARHLEAAGVQVTATRYEGVMHEFFGAAAVLDKARLAQQEAAAHILAELGAVSDPYPEDTASVPTASEV